MPQKRPEYMAGEYYHFYNRGAHRASVFRETTNYLFVLRKLKFYARKYQLTIIAYALMPNHYHFLVRQDGESPVGFLPRYVFNGYSSAYNKRMRNFGAS